MAFQRNWQHPAFHGDPILNYKYGKYGGLGGCSYLLPYYANNRASHQPPCWQPPGCACLAKHHVRKKSKREQQREHRQREREHSPGMQGEQQTQREREREKRERERERGETHQLLLLASSAPQCGAFGESAYALYAPELVSGTWQTDDIRSNRKQWLRGPAVTLDRIDPPASNMIQPVPPQPCLFAESWR